MNQYLTEEEYKQLTKDLEYLETIELPKISNKIAEAREQGDISENAEYDAVKDIKDSIEMRIQILNNKLLNARRITISSGANYIVNYYSTVTVKNISNGCYKTYTLVNDTKTYLKNGKISINTPIAKCLLGKKNGDIACILLPRGKKINFKILNIKK